MDPARLIAATAYDVVQLVNVPLSHFICQGASDRLIIPTRRPWLVIQTSPQIPGLAVQPGRAKRREALTVVVPSQIESIEYLLPNGKEISWLLVKKSRITDNEGLVILHV